MAKRANGEGSVYQQKSDGRWVAKIPLPNGTYKRYYFKTQREASRKHRETMAEVLRGSPLPDGRQRVAQFLTDWLEGVRPSLRATTYKRYHLDVRRINATLGRMYLADLTPQVIQQFLNDLYAQGLSARSVVHCRAVLRVALAQAESWNLIGRNPASEKRVKTPRVQSRAAPEITPAGAMAIVDAFRDHPLEGLVITAIVTGLREGELLGMRWEDVDLDAGVLKVRHQLQRIDGQRLLTEPKSEMGRRAIPVPPFVVEALRKLRVRQLEERMIAGPRWQDTGHVFTSRVGTLLDASNVLHRFQRRLADAGIPRMTIHDLRHAAGALMEALAIPPRTRMEYLGHSQISLTMNTYTRSSLDLKREVADRMDALFRPRINQG